MRQYKLAIHILVIFSIFNFVPVLAAPIAVQGVREACADVADEGEDVIIVSEKRAEEDQDPWPGYHGLRQASPDSGSMSVQFSSSSQHPRMLPSTSNDASGVHQETTNPIQLPSSVSGGTELTNTNPIQLPSSASVGTELPGHTPTNTEPHFKLLTPDSEKSMSKYGIGPATPYESESESSGEIISKSLSKVNQWIQDVENFKSQSKVNQWNQDVENFKSQSKVPPPRYDWQYNFQSQSKPQPKSVWGKLSSKSKSKVPPPQYDWQYNFQSQSKPQPKSVWGKLSSKSKSKVPPPRYDWQYEFQAQSKPQPKSVLGKLSSKSKKAVKKLASVTKSMFREMVDNPKLQIRISATANDAVNAAERELQGKDQH